MEKPDTDWNDLIINWHRQEYGTSVYGYANGQNASWSGKEKTGRNLLQLVEKNDELDASAEENRWCRKALTTVEDGTESE